MAFYRSPMRKHGRPSLESGMSLAQMQSNALDYEDQKEKVEAAHKRWGEEIALTREYMNASRKALDERPTRSVRETSFFRPAGLGPSVLPRRPATRGGHETPPMFAPHTSNISMQDVKEAFPAGSSFAGKRSVTLTATARGLSSSASMPTFSSDAKQNMLEASLSAQSVEAITPSLNRLKPSSVPSRSPELREAQRRWNKVRAPESPMRLTSASPSTNAFSLRAATHLACCHPDCVLPPTLGVATHLACCHPPCVLPPWLRAALTAAGAYGGQARVSLPLLQSPAK